MKICQLHEAEEKYLKIKNEVGELKKIKRQDKY